MHTSQLPGSDASAARLLVCFGSQAAELAPGGKLPVCPCEPTRSNTASTEAMGPERDMRFAVKRKRLPTEAALIHGKNAARLMLVAGSGFPAPGGFAKPRWATIA